MKSSPSTGLSGCADIPGDKSVSHRSLIVGAMTVGETKIKGLLEGQDVLDTVGAMRQFGAKVVQHGSGEWSVFGVGVGGFAEPSQAINCGNSGTAARLIMGAMASTPITATFYGDASLNDRPMNRVTDPLILFGAHCVGRSNGHLPMTVKGAVDPIPIRYSVPVPSAQIKSAILFAGLNAPGKTIVIERKPTRDHTERMLKQFGAHIEIIETDDGCEIHLSGQPELDPQDIVIARDPSSAAFPICAALIVPNSSVFVSGVGLNPARSGLFTTLQEMGADLTIKNLREEAGEPVADLLACHSPDLRGVSVPPERAASMIDEYPVLSVVAAFAEGRTDMQGIGELRVKESDRILAMVDVLRSNAVPVEDGPDWLSVIGTGKKGVIGGTVCRSRFDHRIAMSCLILGLASQKPISVDNAGSIATSFPEFISLMNGLGADIQEVSE
ncbi:MAG: 3-phosphoshikimate 1-carboxyvinyltransferase [Aestuariivita sp.]|nr:3-phosphoshikimate 1-carboxyvinyltransferase [Aestuariivita sp.]